MAALAPPSGEHRYFIKLYALDAKIDLPGGSGKKDLEKAIKGHVIEQAILMGKYNRWLLKAGGSA
jgi:phosphatidylethanolamine-binding protein (PEBP) family uncharacterized protein